MDEESLARRAGESSASVASGEQGTELAVDDDLDARYQAHPSVNTDVPCPICGIRALHRQHCKELCLACGWYQSCVD